jgi:outer membrane protein TolC
LYGLQQQLPWAHTADLTGELQLNLNWTLFDRGARKNNLAKAQANLRAAEARVNATQNNIADEVWKAYSNLETALGQRQAAAELSQRPINRIRLRWNPTTMVSATYWM